MDQSIKGDHNVRIMHQLKERDARLPFRIQVDNGNEFIG